MLCENEYICVSDITEVLDSTRPPVPPAKIPVVRSALKSSRNPESLSGLMWMFA